MRQLARLTLILTSLLAAPALAQQPVLSPDPAHFDGEQLTGRIHQIEIVEGQLPENGLLLDGSVSAGDVVFVLQLENDGPGEFSGFELRSDGVAPTITAVGWIPENPAWAGFTSATIEDFFGVDLLVTMSADRGVAAGERSNPFFVALSASRNFLFDAGLGTLGAFNLLLHCGDGIRHLHERCDDGNDDDLDACRNDCTIPRCGDWVIDTHLGEVCDDGNAIHTDECRMCQLPTCGDGVVDLELGEDCDDGNNENLDECRNDCSENRTPGLAEYFTTFETGQVRPLAMSPDGKNLFAVNTPAGTLDILPIKSNGEIQPAASIPVGLEPVAVAARNNEEVWVVNHLSDSISIVRKNPKWEVVRTLHVGDEPNDVVFAGPGRAFISTAHRGQNLEALGLDPRGEYTVQNQGRADIWVFDPDNLGTAMGGNPLRVLTLFGDKPRPLAVSPDGSRVYAGIFHSGNRTTIVHEGAVCDGGEAAPPCLLEAGFGVTGTAPGGLPAPNTNHEGTVGPETGLIVKYHPGTGGWRDELNRDWRDAVMLSLPDFDVFEIDADFDPAAAPEAAVLWTHRSVGTVLFNMAVNPVSGKVYVTNTEARNEVRFEGMGVHASDPVEGKTSGAAPTVRGHLHEARITVLDGFRVPKPRHLNKHIAYDAVPTPPGVKEQSLATPLGMEISSDGGTLYVAAFGSSKVGVFDTTALENNSFVPNSANHIELTGGGPTGLALDEARGRLYVLTRFDNSVSIIDLETQQEQGRIALPNPEPESVVAGRPFLYDANLTSSNGEASCSSCHIFGDMDDLAWDLGDPDGDVVENPNPNLLENVLPGVFDLNPFHPNKGPMTTQTLRGMANNGPMHWRGDRTGGNPLLVNHPDPVFREINEQNALDERLAFSAFNVAFGGLLGRDDDPTTPEDESRLTSEQMQQFTDFILQVTLPPNPIRGLSNSLRPDEARGRDLFLNKLSDLTILSCIDCHALTPSQGLFGTDGFSSIEGEVQEFKIPHLRNAYQKVGMFGYSDSSPDGVSGLPFFIDGDGGASRGIQVRGFGFLHDGSVDTVARFLSSGVFTLTQQEERDLEAFVMAFDSNLYPIVGQQVTITSSNPTPFAQSRINLMVERAEIPAVRPGHPEATECELVVKSRNQGWLYLPETFRFVSDLASDAELTAAEMFGMASPDMPLTFSCVPPGSGIRMALDRDLDGFWNRDELFAGTDQKNPASFPGACNDGLDNDGDGLADLDDPGCRDANWNIENPACSDGYDNDGIGGTDLADAQCKNPFGKTEHKGCGLGAGLALLMPLLMAVRRQRRRG